MYTRNKRVLAVLKAAWNKPHWSDARSHQCPGNQIKLTVGGVAAKLSISSCVTQTLPVV